MVDCDAGKPALPDYLSERNCGCGVNRKAKDIMDKKYVRQEIVDCLTYTLFHLCRGDIKGTLKFGL